jgi:methyl-accepting chemotaxis protein
MDKVTQSNAANAEESAAAAEELNAQAVTMKDSVADLLQLVGGERQGTVTRTTVAHAPAKSVHIASPTAKRAAPTNGKGNGNGHSHAVKATTGNRLSEIPLAGDFKDF